MAKKTGKSRKAIQQRPPAAAVLRAAAWVGRKGLYEEISRPGRAGAVWWRVKILQVRENCGKVHFLVSPADGEGEFWTTEDRLQLGGKPAKERIRKPSSA